MTDDRRTTGDDVEALVERLVPGLAERLRGGVDEIEMARDGWRVRVRRNGSAPTIFSLRVSTLRSRIFTPRPAQKRSKSAIVHRCRLGVLCQS